MITITPNNQPFSMPPPAVGNMAVPPPLGHRYPPPHGGQRFGPRHNFFQPFRPYVRGVAALDPEFDGKRLRKSAMRKTVDYNSAIIKMMEARVWQRDYRDRRALQPDVTYLPDLQPPQAYDDNAINAVTTRFVKAATNKMRCPIFCMAWTPEGRRLVTGASSGEFTLWNGLTFNFETILQAHDSPVRTMVWSHNDVWMVTADHAGYVKYWQSNMNNVKMFLAHKEAIRGISFSPNDSKFATCSDDGTIRIWDFQRCAEERILRGHGADVKCVHWHPQKGLIISGSKDNQQPVKLWDPKTGQSLATLHAHKSTVMDVKWNNNGNWLVTASRDHLLKLFDIRNLSMEVQTFRGHKKESSSVAWHPYHEGLFCSGGSDGAILFWHVGADKEVGAIEQAHDSIVWTLAWHPLGHILCSGSNDHSSKFWTRNRPGDPMRDKYNLNTLPANLSGLDENEIDDQSVIPGMGPEDKVDLINPSSGTSGAIPGLDIDSTDDKAKIILKKVPYSKPIPKNFQAHWNHAAVTDAEDELTQAIKKGYEAFARYINSGAVEELNDVRPYMDLNDGDEQPKEEADTENQDSNLDLDKEDSWQNKSQNEDTLPETFLGAEDQDMRQLVLQPPPSFIASSDQRILPSQPLSQQPDLFRPPPNRPNLYQQNKFQEEDNFRGGFGDDSENLESTRDFKRPNQNRDFNRGSEFRDEMYRGPNNRFGNMSRGFNEPPPRQEFGMRNRQERSPPPFRGRNQNFMDDMEESRSSFNMSNDQDMRDSFENGDQEDNGEDYGNEQWDNEDRFRDNFNNSNWNEDNRDEEESMEDDFQNGDGRYQRQPQQKFSPRGPRTRGSPHAGRGFDRGRRMRGRGRGGPRGGFRPRGRNPRR